jgi:hypothetical protein
MWLARPDFIESRKNHGADRNTPIAQADAQKAAALAALSAGSIKSG